MKKDEIYQYLVESSNHIDKIISSNLEIYTTKNIEDSFQMKTSVANYHLNELYKEGKLIKINTKPVYYLPFILMERITGFAPSKSTYNSISELIEDKPSNILQQIIGSSGSLEECIRQCRVAINYPGNGLPLLLNGPTGTGKTFLAKCLYHYAVQEGILNEDAPLCIFNCAEYANNPELLGSKLFGHIKGAFTGADKDVSGIIENANKGILLIDEVHRLSAENQEKLFMFMDDGVFRRIGENSGIRKANVSLIFATTEDVNTLMLKTFLRRIPVVVKIPPIDERGSTEKQAFIYHFFQREAKIMSKMIHVEVPVISYLTALHIQGNVGGLENIIKYTCANVYLESKKSQYLLIRQQDLPVLLKNNLTIDLSEDQQEVVKIDGNKIENNPVIMQKITVYSKLLQELGHFFREASRGKIKISQYRDISFANISKYLEKNEITSGKNEKRRFITDIVKSALNLIANQYNIEIEKQCISIIAAYVSEIPGNLQEGQLDEKVDTKKLQSLFSFDYEWCCSFIRVMKQLNVRYPIKYLPLDQLVITSIFDYFSNQKITTKVKAVIVSHGYSTASSLANVANRFIGQTVFCAFDMPVDVDYNEIEKNLENYFRHVDTRDGVIILIDIGNTKNIYQNISNVVEGDIGVIDNVSTNLAIDVGRRIINEELLEKIVEEATQQNTSHSDILKTQRKKEKILIITCQTGVGTAFKIKQLIEKCLANAIFFDVIVSEYSRLERDKASMPIFSRYEVIGIIGTADPKVSQVPFVGLEDLMDQHGAEKLQKLFYGYLSRKEVQELNNKLIKSLSKENIINLLTILNPDKTLQYIENMVHQWEKDFKMIFPNNLVISLYVHLSSMIERVITRNEMTFHENQKDYEDEHAYFFKSMNKAFEIIERNYHNIVPNSEIAYIYDIFRLKMPDFQF